MEIEYIRNKNLNEIKDYISNIYEENSIILIPYFKIDIDGAVYLAKYTTKLISEASNMPVYGLYNFEFPHGIIGGKLVEAYSHGESAILLMDEYFEGNLKKDIVIRDKYANKFKFDYEQLKRFGLEKIQLPEGSVLVNKPISYLEKNSDVIVIMIVIIIGFLLYIGILYSQVKKKTIETQNYLDEMIETKKELINIEKMAGLGEIIVAIAHEINTPLGSIITANSYISLKTEKNIEKLNKNELSKEDFDNLLRVNENSLEIIKNNSVVIKKIIDDFKKLNKLLKVVKKEVNLKSLLSELILINNEKFSENLKIGFSCEENIIIYTDRILLSSVLNILIDNSIQHGYKGKEKGFIYIEVKRTINKIIIEYSDDGNGIVENEVSKIFDPFYTTDKGIKRGLGLYRAFNLIGALKGSIECVSKVDKGALFRIEIPQNKLK